MPPLPSAISLTRRAHLPPNPASKRRAEPPKALPPYLQRITRLISPSPLIRKNYGISEPDPCLDMLTTSQVGECRSEAHASEVQSLMRISNAVFCLKKKRKYNMNLQRIRYSQDTTKRSYTHAN